MIPRQLRAVVFDVDGTLYRQGSLRRAMAFRLVRAHLHRPWAGVSTMRILSAYRHGQESLRCSDGAGRDIALEQVQFASRVSGAAPAVVQAVVTRWMLEAPLNLLAERAQPGMLEFVRNLRNDGLKLGVLSDYPAQAKLEALGLNGMFDCVLCAQQPEVGVFKPNPRGILVALDRLGVAPADALYIGDRAEVDAAAAGAAGVACVILGGRKQAHAGRFLPVDSFEELGNMISRQRETYDTVRGAAAP